MQVRARNLPEWSGDSRLAGNAAFASIMGKMPQATLAAVVVYSSG
jgi:hypothetical protein